MVLLMKLFTFVTQPLVGSENNDFTPLGLLVNAFVNNVESVTFSVLSWPFVWMPRLDNIEIVPDNPEIAENTEERSCDPMLLAVTSPVKVPGVVFPVESVVTICWAPM